MYMYSTVPNVNVLSACLICPDCSIVPFVPIVSPQLALIPVEIPGNSLLLVQIHATPYKLYAGNYIVLTALQLVPPLSNSLTYPPSHSPNPVTSNPQSCDIFNHLYLCLPVPPIIHRLCPIPPLTHPRPPLTPPIPPSVPPPTSQQPPSVPAHPITNISVAGNHK